MLFRNGSTKSKFCKDRGHIRSDRAYLLVWRWSSSKYGTHGTATAVKSRHVMEIKVIELEGIKKLSLDQSTREAIHIGTEVCIMWE